MKELNKSVEEIALNIDYSIQTLKKDLYLGGNNSNELEIIASLPELLSGVNKKIMSQELYDAKLKSLVYLDQCIWNNHPQKQLTVMINEILADSRVNVLSSCVRAGLVITSNKPLVDSFFSPESEPNLEKTFYELFNIGLAVIEGRALLKNLNSAFEYNSPQHKELIIKVSELYLERVTNASKGMQPFGKFNNYPIIATEFIEYINDDNNINENNYKTYIDKQLLLLKNPQAYSHYTKYDLNVLKESELNSNK